MLCHVGILWACAVSLWEEIIIGYSHVHRETATSVEMTTALVAGDCQSLRLGPSAPKHSHAARHLCCYGTNKEVSHAAPGSCLSTISPSQPRGDPRRSHSCCSLSARHRGEQLRPPFLQEMIATLLLLYLLGALLVGLGLRQNIDCEPNLATCEFARHWLGSLCLCRISFTCRSQPSSH